MPLFRLCNLTVGSNTSFPELLPIKENKAELHFRLLPEEGRPPSSGEWFHVLEFPDGRPWLHLGRMGTDYLLRFPNLADFLVSSNGADIRCQAIPEMPLETIRHLFLDQVIPMVLSHQGKLVLHGSAVVIDGEAVAFLGVAGQGKSTLAASFCRQGHPLLTDDCLLLEESGGQLLATPSYPGLRLWSDVIPNLFEEQPMLPQVAHYTEKKRLGTEGGQLHFCLQPIPLGRLYVLDSPVEYRDRRRVGISCIPRQDGFMELVKAAFRLDITDKERLRKQFERLSCVITSFPVRLLSFPHDFTILSAVRKAILEDLKEI